ncbi:hypothetical protein UA08_09381 [Talaromyces atroroseus]|uniref:Uncharacterized protein n=1 Tax=Talaromyces atroroseus TaxID=1441469 RepID=A0A1Q5Q688_TALAT|nr:hypothetical protein UA08_09381 [Talaromyces atroroseus]OKL55376.1 hypothetical protein UA08_09381 [Talaromyces atroroseus]
MKLVYRPSPAELQASATQTRTPAGDGEDLAGLYALFSSQDDGNTEDQLWPSYMNEYPIDKHAGPMFIHDKQNTFCGICGMCITLEDEQAVSWTVNRYTTTGPGTVQHADAGNVEFEELQQGDTDSDCYRANERKFGVMPKPGWTGLYRAVIRQKKKMEPGHQTPTYYVSGVGRYHLWDSDPKARKMYNKCSYEAGEPILTVPINKEDALIDRCHFYNKQLPETQKKNTTQKELVKRISVYPCHFHDENNQNLFPHGFPIHENCWKMAASVIGADKIEANLNSFLAALRARWDDGSTVTGSRQIADWIVNERGDNYGMRAWYTDIASLMTDRSQYDVNRMLVAMNDPLYVEEVEEMVAEGARRYTVMMEEPNHDRLDDEWVTEGGVTVSNTGHSFNTFPQESLMTILDQLHHSEVEAFLIATKLHVPWPYWRRRAPRDIIWELNSINEKATPLDWQYLCLRAERMCEESLGLINRQRICRILHELDEGMAV